MIAALPMYDRPEIAAATDALWSLVRTGLGHGPERLTRGPDPWAIWQAPELVLAQTCSLPYRARLADHVQLLGSPDHRLEGCPPGHYRSAVVARAEDARDLAALLAGRVAVNDRLSQSGHAALWDHAQAEGLAFEVALETGSHVASARAVAEGAADIAALDAVSWRLMQRHDGAPQALRVVALTRPTPALPYICGPAQDAGAVRTALAGAIAALPEADQDALSLYGLTVLPASAYLDLPRPPD